MNDVSSDIDAEIASDSSRSRISGIGFAQHESAGLDSVQAFPNHGQDWTGGHVSDFAEKLNSLSPKTDLEFLILVQKVNLKYA